LRALGAQKSASRIAQDFNGECDTSAFIGGYLRLSAVALLLSHAISIA
jgi:hypothetical protein